jgi:hypothetical protein
MNAVQAKFDRIHEDLEANITKIYRRRDLLTAMDLVVHSVLQFRFQGDLVRKGWVEGLVIGDTRCGKSESVQRLMGHYRAGEIVTGENATFAGLIGGMQQTQKTWSITWGKFPLNDRRFLVIDELSGLPQEAISRMSGVRSSGVAEIVKIQTERTLARVRCLWMSNPRGRRPIAAFNSGIEAIQDLIGQPEDIARFDFALTVATNEVPLSVINSSNRPVITHKYESAACNRLVCWVWSRKPEQVVFAPGAEDACLKAATWLSTKYVAPLVEGAEQRIKVARLAVSAAARVHSTDATGELVVVTPEHVQFVTQYLDTIYTKPSMAFDVHSSAKNADREIPDAQEVQSKFESFPDDVRSLLTDSQSFTAFDLQDFFGVDRDGANDLASFLVRKRCIRKGKFGYYKLPAFIQFLRNFKRGVQHLEPGADAGAPPF